MCRFFVIIPLISFFLRDLNKYIQLLRGVKVLKTSISYRFSVVILIIKCQVDYNCFNEPFAVSTIIVYILSLAWLNL
ncbi:hypothetical protein [Plasmodium yoelii yoelii]|uniref:Uncharacterized protein n=1 Tax=Plasmodium yoelii yoelii TaxID=73239 RepID=Q7RN91_PLAYO|nr:hypothetical protein [Plasmodium yoelii yoelii]